MRRPPEAISPDVTIADRASPPRVPPHQPLYWASWPRVISLAFASFTGVNPHLGEGNQEHDDVPVPGYGNDAPGPGRG